MDTFFAALNAVNSVMLGVPTLLALLGVGVVFTLWSGFGQYRSLTHGFRLLREQVPGVSGQGPGALSHFQALSAALAATVGLGNIGGVAIAIALGGPGAVFWMWMVGIVGMALKSSEVTLSLLYRNTDDPNNPSGGTMWVCRRAYAELSPRLAPLGTVAGALFAVALIFFALTGCNMFQAWNVGEITRAYFGVPPWISGLILSILTAAVILGGIRRIGRFASWLVPAMCGGYVLASLVVIVANASEVPALFSLIFTSAFAPSEAGGAFLGATVGVAFIFGMKRALFSSEAGLGSAPIAHSAVKTPEPVTEGVVAGLEPFIDTLVVCTMTALVILLSGIWNRGPAMTWAEPPAFVETAPGQWQLPEVQLKRTDLAELDPSDRVFVVVERAGARSKLFGDVRQGDDGGALHIRWSALQGSEAPSIVEPGIFIDYPGATLTAKAFDSAWPGLGLWLLPVTVWLFALSTIITYSYLAEQCVVYLFGQRCVLPFRVLWCALVLVSCLGFMRTDVEVDTLSTVALGFMLAVNLPTILIFGPKAMGAWHDYFRRLRNGNVGTLRS